MRSIKLVNVFPTRISNYTQVGLLFLLPEGLCNKKVNYIVRGATLIALRGDPTSEVCEYLLNASDPSVNGLAVV